MVRRDHDDNDRDKRDEPLGEHGAVGQCFDVIALWRERATQVTGRSLPCGHYIAEEAPSLLLEEALHFLRNPS